jgi:hypothetical protein
MAGVRECMVRGLYQRQHWKPSLCVNLMPRFRCVCVNGWCEACTNDNIKNHLCVLIKIRVLGVRERVLRGTKGLFKVLFVC